MTGKISWSPWSLAVTSPGCGSLNACDHLFSAEHHSLYNLLTPSINLANKFTQGVHIFII